MAVGAGGAITVGENGFGWPGSMRGAFSVGSIGGGGGAVVVVVVVVCRGGLLGCLFFLGTRCGQHDHRRDRSATGHRRDTPSQKP